MAAQIVDISSDDVHADAAARDVADGFRRREAGYKNQIVNGIVRQVGFLVHQAALARLGENAVLIEAGAVILDLDDNAAAFVKRIQFQGAGVALAGGQALSGSFQAVVERVAHQMDQRVANLFQHGLVELGVLTGELQLDFLAELAGQIVHQARKAVERKADGQHANLHDAFLQFARVARELGQAAPQ